MSPEPGARLGPYEVLSRIGAGGMGEVYRARDSKLNREVALKILPALFTADPERLARFRREAQVLAALNHPNIAAVYGFEDSGSTLALVMELVPGDDLSALVARGPMPLADALPIAKQIADALEAAHDQGIIHRDLKPANVRVRADGTVKILDFGLAKALGDGSRLREQDPSPTNSPTLTARATQMGMILGTAAYMSPEQARGRAVDRRADIWAFGCVMYELLTGRRTFDGTEVTDVLARVIERDPEWRALPPNTPRDLRRLLERCLTKDPKARLRDIGEARVAIDGLIGSKEPAPEPAAAPAVVPAAARPWLRFVPWALASALGAIALLLWLRPAATPGASAAPPMRVELNLPADVEFFSGPSLSSDGSKLAFIGNRQGTRQIYIRSLNETETRAVAGTLSAVTVAMSPDGAAAAFVTNATRLSRVVFASGVVETIADGASIYSSPAFTPDGAIVFSRGDRLSIRLGDGNERELAKANTAAGEATLTAPKVTADGRTVLFVAQQQISGGLQSRLEAVPTAGGNRRVVRDGVDQPLVASGDRLVFERDGSLFVAPLDASLGSSGPPMRLAESLLVGPIGGLAASVSQSGTLAAAPGTVLQSHLVWVSTAGVERVIRDGPRGFLNPRVSPDGRLIAFSESGTIWTLDPARSTFTRVSSEDKITVGFPLWSPDSKRIYYRSREGIRHRSADGEGDSTLLPNTSNTDYPTSISRDGTTLFVARLSPQTSGDIYQTPASGGEMKPILVTSAYDAGAQISPDGKLLLYMSNASGRMEVYLRPMSGPDRRWPVSGSGGLHALWSADGKRIFYRSGDALLVVDVTTTPDVKLSAPRVLFEQHYTFGQNITIPNYSISPNGREFLMVREVPGGRHLTFVLNWLQALQIPK